MNQTQDATPRHTLQAREGDPDWMVAYLNLGKSGRSPASHGEKAFANADEAIAFFQKQRAGCASLWRRYGASLVEQQLSPDGKEVRPGPSQQE